MSNRRVKAIDYDDDDLGDYDDNEQYDQGGDELSPEDKEQMRLGTIKVRELLSTSVTEADIHDALWHYYYDIPKTVSYLKSQYHPTTSYGKLTTTDLQKPKAVAKPKTADTKRKYTFPDCLPQHNAIAFDTSFQSTNLVRWSDRPQVTVPPNYHTSQCIPIDFFDDCPWLNIPEDRRANILIEPVYPRGGLLGGSSKETKMSKLAALAAKRRQKENQKPIAEPTAQPPQGVDYNAALSKLTLTQSTPKRKVDKAETLDVTDTETAPITQSVIENENLPNAKESTAARDENTPTIGRATPSIFARTVLGGINTPTAPNNFKLPDTTNSKYFDFTEPSPDDIINKAQRVKAAPTSKPKSKESAQAKNNIVNGVNNLSVQETPKIKSKNIDVVSEYKKVKRKNAANFVVIGHVDAGKSTLMGRLLFDLKAVDQRTLDRYKKEAEQIGKGSFAFAWVLDEGSEERERGVTIDIATNKFETEKTSFTILDAPGHQDFVPNMIAGASQADFAVLVIDASGSNFESGLRGQTKEHALLVRSIGVQRIIVAVNKMDTTGWSESRYQDIQQQMSAFLTSAGFQAKNLAFVPCSGLQGDNILNKTTDTKASWYKGQTLVEELDLSEPVTHALEKPLRMTIADVFRGGIQNPLSISGRLESGTIQTGEQIQVQPSSEQATIKSIDIDYETQDWAVAGQNVTLHLTDIDPIHLRTGDVVCSPTTPITNITTFKAKVLAFASLTPQLVDIHRGRLHVPGRISQLIATLDKATGSEIKKKPKVVLPGSLVRIVVVIDSPVPLEMGQRIILRAGGETVAAGLIE